MKNNYTLVSLVILFSLASLSCSANGSQDSAAGGPAARNIQPAPGGQVTPGEQPSPEAPPEQNQRPAMGEVSEGEMLLMRFQRMLMEEELAPEYVLSEAQIQELLPLLENWKAAVEADENADDAVYLEEVTALLTDEQLNYMPQRSGTTAQNGDRMARPGFMPVAEVLAQLIEDLS